VLLISLDSTRRDLLSCYGHEPVHAPARPTTPHIDRIAAEGVLFRDAYASSSWTLVSHMSLMSGEPPLVHGVDDNFQAYGGAGPLLAETLQANGYATAGFFSGPLLEPHYGFGRGFDRYEACYGTELAETSARAAELREARETAEGPQAFEQAALAYGKAKGALMELSHTDVSSQVVTDATLAELERRAEDGRPFFLFAHYFDPHYDYVPPAEHDVFDAGYEGAIDGIAFLTSPSVAGPKQGTKARERRVSDRDLEHIMALYEAELSWTDAEVGRILTRLDELGLAEDTLVIVTSDHGDEFFEHGSIGHRRTLYEEVVQVPMVMRYPGRLPAGTDVDGLVSLVDLPATIVDLAGIEPRTASAGRSVVPMIDGDPKSGEARSVLGRVVQSHPVVLRAEGHGQIPGTQFMVTDSFLQGPIKITRSRSWARPREQGLADLFVESTRTQRAQESIVWVDLEQHPEEGRGAHSHDFNDPGARAALEAFREQYTKLTVRRMPPEVSKGRQRFTAMLRGLGYVDGEEDEDAEGLNENYVLPAPGEHVLGASR
jgi:arylsulfatase A-like enzyme